MTKERFTNLITDVLSVPSTSSHCERMQRYIREFAEDNNLGIEEDAKGNICITKGILAKHEKYVCVINHMDTVQSQVTDVVKDVSLKISSETGNKGGTVLKAYHETSHGEEQTGIGADDKLGCAIAMALLMNTETLKCVFCVDEEIGMLGSKEMPSEWFNDVSFCLSFDSPGRNRSAYSCSGEKLFSDKFFNKILKKLAEKHGVTQFKHEPWTDVVQVRRRFPDIMCWVVGNGGYSAHTSTEYVDVDDAYEAYLLGIDLIQTLGLKFDMKMSSLEKRWFEMWSKVFRRRCNTVKYNLRSRHNPTVNTFKSIFSPRGTKRVKNVKNCKSAYKGNNNTILLEDLLQ